MGQESRLDFSGGTFTNNGLVLVDGHAEIGQGVVFQGAGTIEVEGGGSVSVLGSVSAGQKFVFGYGNGTLSLGNLAQFGATVEVADAGDKVHITDVHAQSLSYDAQTGILLLQDGNGRRIGQLHITVPNDGGTADFTLEPDGKQGSMITYTPQGPVTVQASFR